MTATYRAQRELACQLVALAAAGDPDFDALTTLASRADNQVLLAGILATLAAR